LSDEYETVYEQYEKSNQVLNQKQGELNEKRKQAKQAKADLDDDPVNKAYQEAKEDSETFNKEYEEVKSEDVYALNIEQQKELKDEYRQACRLCHPDIVSDNLKDQANKIMSELNIAKKKQDLYKIKEILHLLKFGLGFEVASDAVDDKELLKNIIANIKNKISLLENEIKELELSETYSIVQEIDDKDEYFSAIKIQLEEEYERLKKELRQLKDEADIDNSVEDFLEDEKMMAKESNNYWTDEF
jgi:DnaJ-domain-containing protein 1